MKKYVLVNKKHYLNTTTHILFCSLVFPELYQLELKHLAELSLHSCVKFTQQTYLSNRT